MVLTITLILAATITLAALELWGFWTLGERDRRRLRRIRLERGRAPAVGTPNNTGTRARPVRTLRRRNTARRKHDASDAARALRGH